MRCGAGTPVRACALPVPLVSTTCACREGVSSSWSAWLLCVHLRYAGRMSSTRRCLCRGERVGIRWLQPACVGYWLLPQPQFPWLKPPLQVYCLQVRQVRHMDADHPCCPRCVYGHSTNDLKCEEPSEYNADFIVSAVKDFFVE